jgi:hypothetical protein
MKLGCEEIAKVNKFTVLTDKMTRRQVKKVTWMKWSWIDWMKVGVLFLWWGENPTNISRGKFL